MTVTTVAINCDIGLADNTEFLDARLDFKLSGPDYDTASNDVIPAHTVSVALGSDGVGVANLWPVDRGVNSTHYTVTVEASFLSNGAVKSETFSIGRITPPSGGPFTLADRLALDSGGIVVGSIVYDTIADAIAATLAAAAAAEANALASGADIYPDTAAGIAGVADDGVFQVPALGGGVLIYQRDGAEADLIGSIKADNFPSRTAALTYIAAGGTFANGVTYNIGGLAFVGATGSTVVIDLPGLLPLGDWTAAHFNLDTTGGGSSTAALANVPDGSVIDMQGGLIQVAAIPLEWRAFNGAWLVGLETISMLTKAPSHALDGQWQVTDRGVGFQYHTGPVWYQKAENRIFRVYGKSMSHAPSAGMPVVVEYSEDEGQTWKQSASLYAHKDYDVPGMSGGMMGSDRMGVIINTRDAADAYGLLFSYSDNNGATWTTPTVITGLTYNHFVYGEMFAVPAVAGGDDDNGFGFFTYDFDADIAYLVYTDDNGATWNERTFYDGAALGEDANEVCIVRVGVENKWIGWIRGDVQWKAFTTTDLTTLTVVDSGIIDTGPGLVGSPPLAIYDDGMVSLYVRNAENWGISGVRDQQLTYYRANASDLYDNGGVFPSNAQQVAVTGVNRVIGMIYHCKTAVGTYAHMRVGEGIYPSSGTQPVSNSIASVTLVPRTVDLKSGHINENLCRNADFYLFETSSASAVSVATMVAESWWTYHSVITFDTVEQVEIDPVISRNFPHRPRYGMRLVATTGNDNAGFEQRYYGKEAILAWADREVTITVYGTGVWPGDVMRAQVHLFYGSSTTVVSTTIFSGVKTYANGGWSASATVLTPTAEGKTFGASPKVYMRVDCGASSAAWDVTICGVKAEYAQHATHMLPVDRAADLAVCRAHTQYFEKSLGLAYRESSLQCIAPVRFAPMVAVPSLSLIGSAANLVVDNLSAGVTVTGFSAANITEHGADFVFSHASSTGYSVGRILSSDAGTYIKATVEG